MKNNKIAQFIRYCTVGIFGELQGSILSPFFLQRYVKTITVKMLNYLHKYVKLFY